MEAAPPEDGGGPPRVESPVEPASREARAPLLETAASHARELARDPSPPQSAIRQAVEQINEIVVSLQQLLDQMEEVLELTELADRQKNTDEREIESLRRALRQIQRPRQERYRDEDRRDRSRDEARPERGDRGDRGESAQRPERYERPAEEESSEPAESHESAPPAESHPADEPGSPGEDPAH